MLAVISYILPGKQYFYKAAQFDNSFVNVKFVLLVTLEILHVAK